MTKPKSKPIPKREKPEEHPEHQPVTLEEFGQMLDQIAQASPPKKEK